MSNKPVFPSNGIRPDNGSSEEEENRSLTTDDDGWPPASGANGDVTAVGDIAGASTRKKPRIKMASPYPLVDEGIYRATCLKATFDWSRRWKKWVVILVLEPIDYTGRPYTGSLCKFLFLGKNKLQPVAGLYFRQLWVEVNGDQPVAADIDGVEIFVGKLYDIRVVTVKTMVISSDSELGETKRKTVPRSPES